MKNTLHTKRWPKRKRLLPTLIQLLVCIFLLTVATAETSLAQGKQVSGRVTSASESSALPGVTILVKGTTTGATTDADGRYSFNVPQDATTLVFSFIGYASQEIPIGNRSEINVQLETDVTSLSEVVVTALGIEKQQRELGYVTQKISSESLIQARETNVVNQLAGKIAGVTVVSSPSGIGGSSRVTIRGERSLNINANQPLFVIDGMPINNNFVGSSGRNNQEADYGNGAGFINPDDIESMTVLKGANASALYGSRAANGVVVITTKSGKNTKGLGISVNSNVTFDTPLRLPDYQNVYGQGLGGEFSFKDGSGGGLQDGVDENWGPKMEGQLLVQHDSPTDKGLRAGDTEVPGGPGNATATPFSPHPDNIKDFFEVGQTFSNNIALTGSNEFGDFRLSYTNLDQKGIVPNTDLKRNTFAFNGGYKLTKKFTARANVNYIRSNSDNRPNLSYGTENIMYLFNCWYGRQIDTKALRNYWQPGLENIQQYNFNYNYHDNPYFNVYENTNGQNVDRIIGNITLSYLLTDWLSVQARTQVDYSDELRTRRRAFSTQRYPFGSFRRETVETIERNSDILLQANKSFGEDFTLNATLGGNQRVSTFDYLDVFASQLTVPGVYSINNARVPLEYGSTISKRKVNSLFAQAQVGYRNFLFLDLTARNDWASTLTLPNGVEGTADNSYFYPSASLSAVVSDIFVLPSFISFAKLRAGIAQVGNDTEPYQFAQPFNPATPWGTTPTFGEVSQIPNLNLKPEISASQEYGIDLRFVNNRIGLDVTFYRNDSRNQIIFVPLSNTTGYGTVVQNAGLIRNQGWEVMLNLVPVQSENNGFRWNIDINWSRNRSEVKELAAGIERYQLADKYFSVEARVGERMGDMYGFAYQRVSNDPTSQYYDPTGQYVGQIINENGRPLRTGNTVKLGNYNPDWLGGIYNTFSYKNFNLGFLFDIRYGGQVYSHSYVVGREGGQLIETLEGRANGYDLAVEGNGVYSPGVILTKNSDGSNSFHVNGSQPTDRELSAREWHTAFTLGRSVLEGAIFDATFAKLREVKFGYTIPDKVLGKLPIRGVNFSIVGRNLAVWTKVPHIDPETSSVAGSTIVPGAESVAIPSTRNIGFNLGFRL
jgi:TonB-linked SusC/RagA family outer membrane protein